MTKGASTNPPMTAAIKLDVFRDIANMCGWKSNAAIARAIGLKPDTVRRIMSGEQEPTIRFVCGILHYSRVAGFRRTFDIVSVTTEKEGTT